MEQEAYVYEAIRTPRAKGKASGELHEVKPIDLVVTLMNELVERTDLDTAQVDDVVLGCVSPVGDQGSDIAKVAAQKAGWDLDVPGVQLNRFCASGLESVNMAAMKVRSGLGKSGGSRRGREYVSLPDDVGTGELGLLIHKQITRLTLCRKELERI